MTTLLFPKRPFSWIRHFLIAAILLALNNVLVILVPTIKYIFGFIGKFEKSFYLVNSSWYLLKWQTGSWWMGGQGSLVHLRLMGFLLAQQDSSWPPPLPCGWLGKLFIGSEKNLRGHLVQLPFLTDEEIEPTEVIYSFSTIPHPKVEHSYETFCKPKRHKPKQFTIHLYGKIFEHPRHKKINSLGFPDTLGYVLVTNAENTWR